MLETMKARRLGLFAAYLCKNNKSQPPPGLGKRSAFNIPRPHLPRRLLAAMVGHDGGALVNDYNIIVPHNESNVNAVKQTVSQLVGI